MGFFWDLWDLWDFLGIYGIYEIFFGIYQKVYEIFLSDLPLGVYKIQPLCN